MRDRVLIEPFLITSGIWVEHIIYRYQIEKITLYLLYSICSYKRKQDW